MRSQTNSVVKSNGDRRSNASRAILIAAGVFIVLFGAPLAIGFRYQLLPLALWDLKAQPIYSGAVHKNGHMERVYGGMEITCGFFALTKRTATN
jgi:hypothetical protein